MAKDKKKIDKNAENNANGIGVEAPEVSEAVSEDGAEAKKSEGSNTVTLSTEEFEAARAEIAAMKKSMDDAILDAQRIQAEFNNFRKRNSGIRAESMDEGVRETVKNLLPVLDNFERALASCDEETPFAKGMVQIQKQLIDCLQKCGLEEVEAEGMFDPNLHEAVMRDEEGDVESGTITAVLQKGYSVKGRIIRHTMVKVKA